MFLLSLFFLPVVISSTTFLLSTNFNYTDFLFPKINLINARNYSNKHVTLIENFSRETLFENAFCNNSSTEIIIKNSIQRFYYISMCAQFAGEEKIKYISYSLPSEMDIYVSGIKIKMNIPYSNMYTLLKDIETNKTFLTSTYMLQTYFSFEDKIIYNPQVNILNNSDSILYYTKLPLQLFSFDFKPIKFDIENLFISYPLFVSFENNNNILKYTYMQYYNNPEKCFYFIKHINNFSIPIMPNLNISGYISNTNNCGNYTFIRTNDYIYKSDIISKSIFRY